MSPSGFTISGVALAVIVGAWGSFAPPDSCPRAVVFCERREGQGAEYVCGVLAQQPSSDDAPRYYWTATGGRIINNPNSTYVTIDARGVRAASALVEVSVTWPKSPPVCRTVERQTIKLL
jgi:hypothetical protein